ncbi:cytochrome P450 1A5-like [Lytechinus variegatus]|uniref:cytochrome P450 1A5-like n=1 Tax=Lytechinus variegatus TaxID=7654 RepID=UPI001BB2108B|nr:cytochrome P450 1A5-like [Lytechinus variegatus]
MIVTDLLAVAASNITFILVIAASFFITRCWINTKLENERVARSGGRPLPGPRGIPVFGNMFSLDKNSPHLSLIKLAKVYGNIFKIQMGSRQVLVLNGLKAIQNALVNQALVFADRPVMFTLKAINDGNIYGPSLSFSQYSEEWKLHRKITETSLRHFTAGDQVQFVEKFARGEAEQLAAYLKDHKYEKCEDIPYLIRLSASNLMFGFMFRKRASYNDKQCIKFIKLFDDLSKSIGNGNILDYLPWLRYFLFDAASGFLKFQDSFNKGIRGLIDEQHELYVRDSAQFIMDEVIDVDYDENEFQRLSVTGRTVLQNAFDFYGAGFGTTASVIEWVMVYMALFPVVQSDVQSEIDRVVGRGRSPAWNDRDQLPLTQSCLLEILRFSTVSPFGIPHSTTKDTVLDGYFVPKDMVVFVNIYSASFDPEVWEQPEAFNPRRFLTEDGLLDETKKKLLPVFGFGRRQCVGSGLARINLFIFFTTLLHQLRFSCLDGNELNLDFKFGLNLIPKNFNIHFESR